MLDMYAEDAVFDASAFFSDGRPCRGARTFDEPLSVAHRYVRERVHGGPLPRRGFRGARGGTRYFVNVPSETTAKYDIDHGIANIIIGFAPFKPAKFVDAEKAPPLKLRQESFKNSGDPPGLGHAPNLSGSGHGCRSSYARSRVRT